MHQNVALKLIQQVEKCTGMPRGQFPFTYRPSNNSFQKGSYITLNYEKKDADKIHA